MHGYDPKEALISLSPRPGEYTLRPEDIISAINRNPRFPLFPLCFVEAPLLTTPCAPILSTAANNQPKKQQQQQQETGNR
jgi:hypothetical protein